MNAQKETYVTYKWDPRTKSGYRLRFCPEYSHSGLPRRYVVETWDNRTIVDDWSCESVEDAVHELERFFELDEKREIEVLRSRFENR